jgi:hypothetical protein
MIFVNSMSDLFHEDVPISYVKKVFAVMRRAHWHRFQVLTKRSERLAELDPKLIWAPNIWMGVSVETDRYTPRIDDLRKTQAHVKFLSLEPLLGPLPDLNLEGIGWVIVGGERVVSVGVDDSLESLDLGRDPTCGGPPIQSYVRVMRGCDKFCSYCVVPFTRGRERSRPPEHVIDEARRLADAGCIELTLLGQTALAFVEFLKQHGITSAHVTMVKFHSYRTAKLELNNKRILEARDYQDAYHVKLTSRDKPPAQLVDLQTGKGKNNRISDKEKTTIL